MNMTCFASVLILYACANISYGVPYVYNTTASVTITINIQQIDNWQLLQLCPKKYFLLQMGHFCLQERAL